MSDDLLTRDEFLARDFPTRSALDVSCPMFRGRFRCGAKQGEPCVGGRKRKPYRGVHARRQDWYDVLLNSAASFYDEMARERDRTASRVLSRIDSETTR